jgi:hypothetical protein
MCDRASDAPELSTGNYAGGERMVQFMAQYHCPRCDGAIAQECVESAPAKDAPQWQLPRRIIRVACEHCHEVFEARFVLAGGYYVIDTAPEVVTDARARERMFKRIDRIRGERLALADAR